MTKQCTECLLPKDTSEFYFRGCKTRAGEIFSECKTCVSDKQAKHRKLNPEKYRARQKRYREQYKLQGKTRRKQKPEYTLFYDARSRARKKNLAFDIHQEDIQIPRVCPVLDIPLYMASNRRTDNSPSLDRIDNTKGYIKGNIVVVSWRANRFKSSLSIDEISRLYTFYKNL